MRLLSGSDRVLADRNIRVVIGGARRNAAGQAFADGLEAKGWALVTQPEPGDLGTYAFVVRSRDEHSYSSTRATMSFEWGAATLSGVLPEWVSLLDMGEDPGIVDIVTAPAREAAAAAAGAAARAQQAVTNLADDVRRGIDSAADGLGVGALGRGVERASTAIAVFAIGVPVALALGALAFLVWQGRKRS